MTLAIAMLGLGVIGTTVNLSTMVYAEKAADPNCFGEEASQLGEGGQMGEHSKEGGAAGDAPFDGTGEDGPGREGIGNVGGEGSDTHPSELAEDLNQDEECEVEED